MHHHLLSHVSFPFNQWCTQHSGFKLHIVALSLLYAMPLVEYPLNVFLVLFTDILVLYLEFQWPQ